MLNSSRIQSALSLINTALSCTISVTQTWHAVETCCPYGWGTDRPQRNKGCLPNHPTHSSCVGKYTDFSLENFHQGLLWLRLLKSLLCTPAAGHTLCRKLLRISRRQKSNRIVFLWKKKKSFPVSETVSKCLQCSSPPACSSIFWIGLSRQFGCQHKLFGKGRSAGRWAATLAISSLKKKKI